MFCTQYLKEVLQGQNLSYIINHNLIHADSWSKELSDKSMIDRSIFRHVCSIDISYLSTFEWHKINTWQVDSYWHEYLTSRQLLTRISDKSTVIDTNIWQVHSKSHEYLTSRRLIDKKLIWNDTNIKHLTCRQLSDTNMWQVDTKNPPDNSTKPPDISSIYR